ncbi:hypothetical protein [Aquicoccus porphyridii]|uniref:Cation/multidrug efflux pump n=1 Tax=Aquicoccus porphyridii TaxID=1852029 RepID=A0A5A9YZ79_9RHOB|nr:hypothetical protein [Aquicoccus porphyridii]KAA0910261.1 hypothetical protein FLO80_17425 [Aquicoccus porphyridii]RAI54408.1 hypothetical protein DOO74_09270 [Rhodobacteraceae bacterium AsT-22]
MGGLIRLVIFGFLALSVIYVVVSIYSRSVRREKLEQSWDADHPDGGDESARNAYIEDGMRAYETGLRRKLILLVYIVPTVAAAVLIYMIN